MPTSARPSPLARGPALAFAKIHREVWGLPEVDLSLETDRRDGLLLRSEQPVPPAMRVVGRGFEDHGVYLLVVEGGEVPFQAHVYFSQAGLDPSEQPRIAALHEPEAKRRPFPGESLVELSGRSAYETSFGRLTVTALDSESVARGRKVAPLLLPLRRGDGVSRLRRALWLDLDLGVDEVERVVSRLEQLPVVTSSRRRYWSDLHSVLQPLARRFDRLTLEVTSEPTSFRLRLNGTAGVRETSSESGS